MHVKLLVLLDMRLLDLLLPLLVRENELLVLHVVLLLLEFENSVFGQLSLYIHDWFVIQSTYQRNDPPLRK